MLFQKKCLPIQSTLFVCALLFVAGCKHKGYSSPQGYQINNPERTALGKVLNEVSGICYNPDDNSLLAVSDSKEKVFQMDLKNIKLKDYTEKVVPENSDLEDIVKVDSSLYLLRSNGTLVEVPDKAKDSSGIKSYAIDLKGTNDFETVYHDPTGGGLVIMCKTCAHEKGEGIRTAYRFDLAKKTFDTTAFYTISKDEIKNVLKNSDAKFDPSAAPIHPVN